MRISARLRTLLVCAMLEYAAMMGSPMRPEEIQELMHQMNQPKLAHVLRDDDDAGDGEPETTNHLPPTTD
jgi:hypothetical protein